MLYKECVFIFSPEDSPLHGLVGEYNTVSGVEGAPFYIFGMFSNDGCQFPKGR